MKILHLIWAFNVGGAESMLVDIMNEQIKNHDVHLMIVNQLESKALVNQIDKNVTVHRIFRKPGSGSIIKMVLCNFKILKLNPDVIHCHNHDLIQFIPLVKKKTRDVYLTVHAIGYSTSNFMKFTRLFAISDAVRKDVFDRSKLNATVVCNGIKVDKVTIKNNYQYEKFKIVQVGRLCSTTKGQDIAINAIAHLVHDKNIKNISIDFIGTGESKNQLRELADKLNVLDYCHFRGLKTREWIYENLCSYDLFVQPSRYEGFGLTITEAMAAKVPVLVSDQGGPMEIIENGKYGHSFRTGDSLDLAEKMAMIHKGYRSKEFHEKISKGYFRVVELYDIKRTAAVYINEYESHSKQPASSKFSMKLNLIQSKHRKVEKWIKKNLDNYNRS